MLGVCSSSFQIKKILDMEDTWFPYLFRGESKYIVRREEDSNDKRWPPEKDCSPHEDFGVIIKTQNKNHPEEWILVLAGLGTLATAGAGYFFSNKIKEISKKYKEKKFGIVIKVDSRHGYRFAREIDSVTFND
jgi:hypothetical protein